LVIDSHGHGRGLGLGFPQTLKPPFFPYARSVKASAQTFPLPILNGLCSLLCLFLFPPGTPFFSPPPPVRAEDAFVSIQTPPSVPFLVSHLPSRPVYAHVLSAPPCRCGLFFFLSLRSSFRTGPMNIKVSGTFAHWSRHKGQSHLWPPDELLSKDRQYVSPADCFPLFFPPVRGLV